MGQRTLFSVSKVKHCSGAVGKNECLIGRLVAGNRPETGGDLSMSRLKVGVTSTGGPKPTSVEKAGDDLVDRSES